MDGLKLYGSSQPNIDSLIKTVCTVTDDVGTRFEIDDA